MRLIDADALMKNIGKIPQLRGITYSRMKRAVEETPIIDAEPVVRCKDCVFFRDRHVLTDDGQRKSYAEFPPEVFSLLGDGGVTGAYGINVGSQCLVDCNKGYSDDKTVFRGPDEFCARAVKKMDAKEENK